MILPPAWVENLELVTLVLPHPFDYTQNSSQAIRLYHWHSIFSVTESQFVMLIIPALSDNTSQKLVFIEIKLGSGLKFIISWNVCLRKKTNYYLLSRPLNLLNIQASLITLFNICKPGDVKYVNTRGFTSYCNGPETSVYEYKACDLPIE